MIRIIGLGWLYNALQRTQSAERVADSVGSQVAQAAGELKEAVGKTSEAARKATKKTLAASTATSILFNEAAAVERSMINGKD